ncbi:MAG: hypothetical protein K8R68_02830, partial [Bacteroidales bacterium]|nr:hypothetical protein [Bacteroidales bacterium]
MTKFVETVIIGLGTFVLSIFLPKQVITLVRELIRFIFNSFFKYWYLTVLILGLVFYINFLTDFVYLGEYTSLKFVLLTALFISISIPPIALFKILFKKYKPINIALYGCFSVKENEYLTTDFDSENLNEKIESICESVSPRVFSYRTNFLIINNISIPKFIPIILGYKRFNQFIKKRILSKKHLATIHFIRDINKQNLVSIINFDKNIIKNTESISTAEKLINNLSLDTNLNTIKSIELNVKIYLLMFGQSMTDFLLMKKQYDSVQCILDDTEKLISSIRNDSINIPKKHRKLVEEFLIYWSGYIERYKAVLLIEQKQFLGALQHIIKSIKLNPYFPYSNYISLKQDFSKKYGINLASTLNELNNQEKIKLQAQDYYKVKEGLMQQINYPELTFNYEIINEILRNNNSVEIGEKLECELEKLDNNDPFILLTKAEIYKYIKKGTKKYNEIYVNQIDVCISYLKETLKLDSEFPIIN